MSSVPSSEKMSIEKLSQIDTIKSIIFDNHNSIIKESKDILFKNKDFISISNSELPNHLYYFRFKLGKHKLDLNIFVETIHDDFLNYKIKIQFNTFENNYYLHYSFIKYLSNIFCKTEVNYHNIITNEEDFVINTILIKDKGDRDVFDWEDIINIFNNYIIDFGERCFISNKTDVPLFQPNPDFNPLLVINENFIDEYNTLFVQKDKLTNFIENNPDVFQIINIMIKTVFLSKRYNVVFDELEYFKHLGLNTDSKSAKDNVVEFIKKWDTLKHYLDHNKFKEYNFYNEFPIFYRTFLYFINKLSKYTFKKCDIGEKFEKEDCIVLELTSSSDEDKDIVFETHKNDYAFHGSVPENWYSIINSGLKPGNVKKGTLINANVYGAGIYLSDSPHYSFHYSTSSNCKQISVNHSNYYIMGVYQVFKPIETYKKAPKIYVVPNPNEVKLKYLFVMKNSVNRLKIIDMINKQFSNTKLKQTAQDMLDLSSKINNIRLKKEYNSIILEKNIQKREKEGLFIKPVFNPDTMNIWRFNFLKENLPIETTLYKQLSSKNIDFINLEIRFKERYPFEAPFVRIIHPRFKFRTGHITLGGSICTELLSPSGWTPIIQTEKLLFHIKQLLVDGGAELDLDNCHKKYELKEAETAFKRMLQTHNW